MTAVTDAIAASLAELTREQPSPESPLGYGVDLSCVESVYDDLRTVDPYTADGIVEAALRRLVTPRGTLPDDPEYGYDLRALLHVGTSDADLLEAQGRARSEVLKDAEVVADAKIQITRIEPTILEISITITPTDYTVVIPTFVFSIDDGAVTYRRLHS